MNPDSSSRHGWTRHDRAERVSTSTRSRSSRRTWLRSIGYALILSLVVFLDVFGNLPVVAAASHAAPKLPVPNASYTLQQFLKQGQPYHAKDAPLSVGKPTPPRGTSLPTKTTQPKLSAEPAKMKAVSQSLASSSTNSSTSSAATASATGTPTATPVRVVGSDADGVRLEVVIPAGAIDVSKATTSKGKAPQGALTIAVGQLSGHSIGMNTSLGTFQIQITDATGATINGITLRSPATFILHYRKKELQQLDLEPKQLVMAWPTLTGSSNATTAKNAVIAMTNNTAASTLTAQSSILESAAVTIGISDPMNQSPQKPHMQGMDPYDYVGGNPETRNDPTGHCWPVCTMLIGAAIGAAVGAGVSIGSQMASGHSVNWGEVGKQAAVGAVTGAVSGLAGPEAGVLVHAAIGAAAGAVGQATSNAIDHKPIGDGVLEAAAIGGVTGGIAEGVGPLAKKVGSAIISKVGDTIGATAADAVESASSTAAAACGLSFSAQTQVATPSGEKAIDTLQVGDQVQAFDPATK